MRKTTTRSCRIGNNFKKCLKATFQKRNFAKFLRSERCKSVQDVYISENAAKQGYFLAKIGFDTDGNEPPEVSWTIKNLRGVLNGNIRGHTGDIELKARQKLELVTESKIQKTVGTQVVGTFGDFACGSPFLPYCYSNACVQSAELIRNWSVLISCGRKSRKSAELPWYVKSSVTWINVSGPSRIAYAPLSRIQVPLREQDRHSRRWGMGHDLGWR